MHSCSKEGGRAGIAGVLKWGTKAAGVCRGRQRGRHGEGRQDDWWGSVCLLEGVGLEDFEAVDVKHSDGRLARAAANCLVEALHQPAEGARVECLAH
eukprot:scaffold44525_cov63-Phaeocystis_antarctica.AAC.3